MNVNGKHHCLILIRIKQNTGWLFPHCHSQTPSCPHSGSEIHLSRFCVKWKVRAAFSINGELIAPNSSRWWKTVSNSRVWQPQKSCAILISLVKENLVKSFLNVCWESKLVQLKLQKNATHITKKWRSCMKAIIQTWGAMGLLTATVDRTLSYLG